MNWILFRSPMGFISASLPLLAIMWNTAAAQAPGQPGIVLSEFIFLTAPFPHCHASTIEATSHGLVSAWFGGPHEGHKDVGIWVSRKIDGRWTPPVEVANGVQYAFPSGKLDRHPCWNPVLFQPREGPLLLFYKCGPSPSTWWGMLTTLSDRDTNWSAPCRLPEGILGPIKDKPIQLANGDLLCGASTEHDGWRVHIERTRDLGKTWTRTASLYPDRPEQAIQPTFLHHAGGRLQMLCRNRDGNGDLWQSWSTDGGVTWTPLAATGLPNPNAGVDAVTLRDGRHLLVYNHTHRGGESPRGREMLNVAVSSDGKQWKAALVLENTVQSEFSYPAVIQTADGLVHITYTWKRKRIKHVVLDPRKLELRAIRNGRWPGS